MTGFSHMLCVSHLVDLAKAAKKPDDVAKYSALLAGLKASYHKAYWNPSKARKSIYCFRQESRARERRSNHCSLGAAACYLLFMLTCALLMTSSHSKANYGASQTANLLPLFLEIPPTPEAKAGAVKALVSDLVAHGNTTTSGIIGNAYLLQVLMKVAPNMASDNAHRSTYQDV